MIWFACENLFVNHGQFDFANGDKLEGTLYHYVVSSDYEKHDEITEETLKPVNKVKSKLDKELQEWEVESTKDGQDSQGE
jgi:hypothetical protein